MQQQQQLLCDSQGYIQGNLPNRQSDQQYLLNQNMMNSFQEANDSTMVNTKLNSYSLDHRLLLVKVLMSIFA